MFRCNSWDGNPDLYTWQHNLLFVVYFPPDGLLAEYFQAYPALPASGFHGVKIILAKDSVVSRTRIAILTSRLIAPPLVLFDVVSEQPIGLDEMIHDTYH